MFYRISSKHLLVQTVHEHRSGVYTVHFEQVYIVLHCSGVSIIDFEQVNAGWVAAM